MRWPVPVAHCGRTSAGAVKTTTPAGISVTVIAKVVLRLDAADATLAAPQALVARDGHDGDDPEQSVTRPCETAPRVLQPEIVVVRATARQPGKQPAPTRAVALAVYREQTPLLTKMLHVYGERDAKNPQAVQPFVEMPIAWARSRFEPSVNPFGIRPNEPRLPNVVTPQHPQAPASLEPLARRTPWRKGLLGGVAPAIADGLEPVLPADFNWEYYQCAPRDQRFAGIVGGEWIVVDGVSFESPRLQCRLPRLSTRARVHVRGAQAPIELALATDLVIVDAQAMTISLVARGRTPWVEGMSVTVTAEGPGVPAEWPAQGDIPPQSVPRLAYAGTAAAEAAPTLETAALSEQAQRDAADKKTAPFEIAAPKAARANTPGAPQVPPVVSAAFVVPASAVGSSKQTMAIPADALRAPQHVASAPVSAPTAAPAVEPKKETLGERFARGEVPKPAPAPPPIIAAPAPAPAKPPEARRPASATAPVERLGVKRSSTPKKGPLDRSPEGVAERMWKAGVSKADIEAYLASVKA